MSSPDLIHIQPPAFAGMFQALTLTGIFQSRVLTGTFQPPMITWAFHPTAFTGTCVCTQLSNHADIFTVCTLSGCPFVRDFEIYSNTEIVFGLIFNRKVHFTQMRHDKVYQINIQLHIIKIC